MPKQQVEFDPIDGLVVDEVGAWASEKHERLKKYIGASRGARAKFLPPKGLGAGYIELFSGPGKSHLKDTPDFIDRLATQPLASARILEPIVAVHEILLAL